jgi:Putative protein-S-isoprenylcysteine methyltransferase
LRFLSILGFVGAAMSMVGLWQERALLAGGWLGQAVQVLAVGLMLWARWTFGRRSFHAAANPTAGGLVTTGPYRYVRHPIYAAVLYFTWAGALSHASPLPILLAGGVTLGLALRMRAEEHLVLQRYGDYRDYAARTRRVVPKLL